MFPYIPFLFLWQCSNTDDLDIELQDLKKKLYKKTVYPVIWENAQIIHLKAGYRIKEDSKQESCTVYTIPMSTGE